MGEVLLGLLRLCFWWECLRDGFIFVVWLMVFISALLALYTLLLESLS